MDNKNISNVSDAEINRFIVRLRDTSDLTFSQIAGKVEDRFGLEFTDDAIRGRYRRNRELGGEDELLLDSPMIEKEYAGEDIGGLSNEEETLVEKVLREANLDQTVWNVESANVSTWRTPLRQADGTTSLEQNWSVKLRVKPLGIALTPEQLFDRIAEMAPKDTPRSPRKDTGKLFVPSIYDAHIEKLADDGKDEDVTAIYIDCLLQLIDRAGEFDHTLLVIGNDLGNVDNINMTTTAGTIVENKYDFYQGSQYRCALMVTAIDILLKHSPVTVMVVPGNHDRQTSYWLGLYLDAYYRNNEDTQIVNTPSDVEWYRWGSTMFMFTHGDKIKPDRLVGFMATQQPKMFAECRNREVFTGHLHVYRRMDIELQDSYGVVLRYMPGLSVTDKWHREQYFIGSRRGAIGLVYDQAKGWINEFPAFV